MAPTPILGVAAEILSSVLKQVSQTQQNTEIAETIAGRCIRAYQMVEAHLKTVQGTPETLCHVKQFEG